MANSEDGWRIEDVLAQSAWMRRLAHRLVADAAHRDDAVQDAWIEALRHGRSARALRPWLAGVLRNLVRMRARSETRRRSREEVDEACAPPATPEQLVERVEIEREVATALLEIDEPYRSTLLWRYHDDLSAAEIARRSGVPAGTVRWRLKQGLEKLRAKLDQRFNGDRRRWSIALIPSAAAARGGLSKVALATLGGALIMKATIKGIVALIILVMLALGGVRLWQHRSASNEVTNARPGVAWRIPGGVGGANVAPTVAGVVVPSWFGQRGAPVRRIAGRVTFAGEPVSGAIVELGSELSDAGVMPVAKRQTASDGRFDFGTQPPAKFSVAASANGRSPAIAEVDTRNPKSATDNLELRLGGCESVLFGHVNDSTGGPIAAAQVCLAPPRASACVSADAQGAYTICLSPTRQFVTVKAAGYGGIYDRVLFKGRRVQRDYFLTPEATLVGRVVRAENDEPVPGASVRVEAVGGNAQRFAAPSATTTDSHGRFTLAGLAPGRQHLMAFADGLASEAVDVNVQAGKSSGDVLLRLRPASRLSGIVTDGHEPIAGATVWLGLPDMRAPLDAITQSDGSFVLEPVARGRKPIAVGEYDVQEPKFVTIDRPEVSVRVLVRGMGSISGHVSLSGKPFAGAFVECHSVEAVFSDADGAYTIRGLPPGPYRVYASNLETGAFGFAPEFALAKDERRTGVDIDIKYNATISGMVVESNGKPVSGVGVFYDALHHNDHGNDTTATDGTFRVTDMLGGDDYRLTVRSSVLNLAPLRIADGGGQLVNLKDGTAEVSGVRIVVVRDHLGISGSTIDGDEHAISDVRVVAIRNEGDSASLAEWMDYPSAISAADGSFAIADLDAGTFVLRAHGGDGSEAIVRGVNAGQKNVVIKLERPGGIDGTLVGFTSQPAVQATRQLPGALPPPAFATVDGSKFQFRGLSPGTYQVAAVGASTDAQVVEVAAAQIATVTLKGRGSTTVRGRVVDWATGAPVPGLSCYAGLRTSVSAMPIWLDTIQAFSDDNGAFQLDDVPAGAVAIGCDGKPYYWTNGRAELTLTAGQNATCDVPVVKFNRDTAFASMEAQFQPGPMPARIMTVTPRGPADRAGVRVGDVISTIDGANVKTLTPMGVFFVVGQRPVGSTMHLGLTRGDQPVTTDVVMVAQ